MIPPTSIDGTDITGATIDGTDVQEITVDGDTVFSAQTLPVAYSNLIAWYPFDSVNYGGSNADDVTAIIGGSGDDTAYDGTVNGATYQSSGGVTDINAGANSGAFDFDGSNDHIDFGSGLVLPTDFSVTVWAKADTFPSNRNFLFAVDNGSVSMGRAVTGSGGFQATIFAGGGHNGVSLGSAFTGTYGHFAMTYDDSAAEMTGYFDGVLMGSTSVPSFPSKSDMYLGSYDGSILFWDGPADDLRVYNKALTSSEVSDIHNNTDV